MSPYRLAAAFLLALVPLRASAAGDASVRNAVVKSFADVRSYKLTVLGNVRSLGVFVAPNRYQMTTMFGGKPIKTIIIGRDYWMRNGGKWQRSGTTANQLDVDIAGLVRDAKANPQIPFAKLPDSMQAGKPVGTFGYTFKNGTTEACNYDKRTFRVTRCKADELTLLYSAYNDPANVVPKPT